MITRLHSCILTCKQGLDKSAYGEQVADELLDDADERIPPDDALGAGPLLLVVLAGGAALRSALPPAPPSVGLAGLSGSALDGESFVRLNLSLRAEGVRQLGDAHLTVAGATARGQHPPAFDRRGRMTLQVDVTPACADVAAGATSGRLDLALRDEQGRSRQVRLDVPADGPLERLLRYRCR